MTTHKEALKHLKAITEAFGPDEGIELDQKAWSKLHAAIKEALDQPEQEPVAWEGVTKLEIPAGTPRLIFTDKVRAQEWLSGFVEGHALLKPLYTASYVATPRPQRQCNVKPLTDEEIYLATNQIDRNKKGWAVKFARAIEAAHGIKE